MIKYIPYNVSKYFGLAFKTNNSTWSISKNGEIFGDSKYFLRHPEVSNAKIEYIGSISYEKLVEIKCESSTQDELEKKTLESLVPIIAGNHAIIGVKINGLEKTLQILTTKINELNSVPEGI